MSLDVWARRSGNASERVKGMSSWGVQKESWKCSRQSTRSSGRGRFPDLWTPSFTTSFDLTLRHPLRVPVTKLGRLVNDGKIKSMEEIYLFSLPIKEFQIVDKFLPTLKDEVMSISPVQKQTSAGQRTRFKAFVAVGDFDGHVGLGVKVAKEVATAIRGAIIVAKLSVVPVRRGYWGNHIQDPHTVPCKVSGKSGSVMCRLVPARECIVIQGRNRILTRDDCAARGTGIVAAPAAKRLLQMAGVQDCYTQSKGSTATQGNFLKATLAAIAKTYEFLSPDLWKIIPPGQTPYVFSSGVISGTVADPLSSAAVTTSSPLSSRWVPRRTPTKRFLAHEDPFVSGCYQSSLVPVCSGIVFFAL